MMFVRLALANDGKFCPAHVEWRISFTRNILISNVRKMYCHCGTFFSAISSHQCLWHAPPAARMICGYQNRFNIFMRSDRPMCCSGKRYRCIKVYTRYSPRSRSCPLRFTHISYGRIIHISLHRFIPFTFHITFSLVSGIPPLSCQNRSKTGEKRIVRSMCTSAHMEMNRIWRAEFEWKCHSWCASLAWIDTHETYPNTHIQFPWQRNGPRSLYQQMGDCEQEHSRLPACNDKNDKEYIKRSTQMMEDREREELRAGDVLSIWHTIHGSQRLDIKWRRKSRFSHFLRDISFT